MVARFSLATVQTSYSKTVLETIPLFKDAKTVSSYWGMSCAYVTYMSIIVALVVKFELDDTELKADFKRFYRKVKNDKIFRRIRDEFVEESMEGHIDSYFIELDM